MAPRGQALYMATHYENFYQASPLARLSEYAEDIALWGVNTVITEMPGPSSFSNGESEVTLS
jgi:hypothetical protein